MFINMILSTAKTSFRRATQFNVQHFCAHKLAMICKWFTYFFNCCRHLCLQRMTLTSTAFFITLFTKYAKEKKCFLGISLISASYCTFDKGMSKLLHGNSL